MIDKSIRRKVEALKRQKVAGRKVVDLADFRKLKSSKMVKTILVVDDDEVMRSALKRILECEGYQAFVAEDGLELSKVLETSRLDLILLDVNLPWVDGFELCSILKDQKNLKNVPVIMVSSRSAKEDIERAFSVGADDYVTKPFDIENMIDIVNENLLKSLV